MSWETWLFMLLGVALLFMVVSRACGEGDGSGINEPATVMEVMTGEGEYATMRSLIVLGGLEAVVEGDGPVTVFAPTDRAFEKLNADVLADLKKESNRETLRQVLSFHLAPGMYLRNDLINMEVVPTLEGQTLRVGVVGETVSVDGAVLVGGERLAGNGVVHGIDRVLLPGGLDGLGLEKEIDGE